MDRLHVSTVLPVDYQAARNPRKCKHKIDDNGVFDPDEIDDYDVNRKIDRLTGGALWRRYFAAPVGSTEARAVLAEINAGNQDRAAEPA